MLFLVALIICFVPVALMIVIAHVCFRLAFGVPRETVMTLPNSEQYAPYAEESQRLMTAAANTSCESVYTTSRDGYRLRARYYHTRDGAPLQIMFHGYRSIGERDFCGGLLEATNGGYNVLLVDQRAHGESEGKCLTFGIMEKYDCLSWVEYATARFGKYQKIILYGMSMGASTVLMASGLELPKNVVGVVADCGYTSPEAIIKKVIADYGYPLGLATFFVRLGGILFGHFDISSKTHTNYLAKSKTPTLFIHGSDDRFVPCEMGIENYNTCACNQKKLLVVDGAGHGISYMTDKPAYMSAVNDFFADVLQK